MTIPSAFEMISRGMAPCLQPVGGFGAAFEKSGKQFSKKSTRQRAPETLNETGRQSAGNGFRGRLVCK
jgi:hypothetical protein